MNIATSNIIIFLSGMLIGFFITQKIYKKKLEKRKRVKKKKVKGRGGAFYIPR